MGRQTSWRYRIRQSAATPRKAYSITVPNALAEALPEGVLYRPELTDDGILYRPLNPDDPGPPVDLPAWARRDDA